MFTTSDARYSGIDRCEFTSIFDRGIRLHVPGVDLTGTTVEEEKDDVLGFAKACQGTGLPAFGKCIAQSQTHDSQAKGPVELAARDVRVAGHHKLIIRSRSIVIKAYRSESAGLGSRSYEGANAPACIGFFRVQALAGLT